MQGTTLRSSLCNATGSLPPAGLVLAAAAEKAAAGSRWARRQRSSTYAPRHFLCTVRYLLVLATTTRTIMDTCNNDIIPIIVIIIIIINLPVSSSSSSFSSPSPTSSTLHTQGTYSGRMENGRGGSPARPSQARVKSHHVYDPRSRSRSRLTLTAHVHHHRSTWERREWLHFLESF